MVAHAEKQDKRPAFSDAALHGAGDGHCGLSGIRIITGRNCVPVLRNRFTVYLNCYRISGRNLSLTGICIAAGYRHLGIGQAFALTVRETSCSVAEIVS